MPSTRASRLTAILTAVALVILCAAAFFLRAIEPRIRSLDGTIVTIDHDAAEATLELRNPKNGKMIRETGRIAEDCQFFVGDRPAEPSAFRPGDEVTVELEIHPYPFKIIVTEATKVTPSPSTTTSAGTDAGV
jgi:hypothetical protein